MEDTQSGLSEEPKSNMDFKNRPKEPLFQWDGKINAGHVLTIFTIIIAFGGLLFQKKLVDNKVDSLKILVDSLEQEKRIRESQVTEERISRIKDFSNNLEYSTNQFVATDIATSHESMVMISEANDIISLFIKQRNLSAGDKKKLSILLEWNKARKEVYLQGQIFQAKRREFDAKFEPQKDKYCSIEEYNVAMKIYNDTLSKNIAWLLKNLDSSLIIPKEKIGRLEGEYLSLARAN